MRSNSAKSRHVIRKVLLPSLLINSLSLAIPLTVLQIYDRILPNQSYGTATLLLAGALVALSLEALIRFVRTWILSAAASNTETRTYQTLVESVGGASSVELRRIGVGAVEDGLSSVGKVKDWYSGGTVAGFVDLPFALIFLALVAYIGGELVLVPVVVWTVTLLLVWLTSLKTKQLSEQASQLEQERKGFILLVSQTLQGIKRQAVESRIFSHFKRLNADRSLAKAEEEQQNAFAQECIQLAALATSVVLVIVGSLWVLDGELTTGGLAACSILSGRAVAPLSALIGVRIKLNSIHSADKAIEKLRHLAPASKVSQDDYDVSDLKVSRLSATRYGTRYHVSLQASRGSITLLSSEERHIDSFMLAVLASVDESQNGDISIDENRVPSLAPYAAYCGVKGQLVAGTLLDNLCGFNPHRVEHIQRYCDALGLSQVITRLPDGLETKIGHTPSSPLSMGNVKLLNLATQFASAKPILLLDKPDASLSLESLKKLADLLVAERNAGRIIVLVSHHPALQQLADQRLQVTNFVSDKEAE